MGDQVHDIANRVDRSTRTGGTRGRVPMDGDRVRDGWARSISLGFEGDPFPMVDPLSVQWSSEGAFVWAVRDGKATRVPVKIRQRNAESVLVEGELTEGEQVVTEGTQSLRPGYEVTIAGETASNAAPTTAADQS